MKHILYANNDFDAVQDALNAGTLENPYIAAVTSGSGISIDYNTLEQQSCQERGLCGDDPYNCHECSCEEQFSDPAEICACEGGYFWGDECHDEPEPAPSDPCEEYEDGTQEKCECEGKYWYNDTCNDEPEPDPDPCQGDPECGCNNQGGFWDGSECHTDWNCENNWQDMGFATESDCNCEKNSICSCEENYQILGASSPEECECTMQGGTWDGENCNFDEGE